MQVRLLTGLSRVSIKILLLEDDLLFGETIVDLLEDEGYTVEHFANGQDALDATFREKFDLYLLDINVPLINGLSLLKELREAEDTTPTIFLTSRKDKESLEEGFLNGGDDYITKPFDMDEMLLRIKAVLRRSKKDEANCIDDFCYDELHKTIRYKGKVLELSQKEYGLLLLFIKHINETLPKELIIDELWSSAEGGSDGVVRVYVNRLKQLLPELNIENVRGIGYRLVS
ncbi:MAG TPA: response regulator transcription factor [Sulfurimonas autotrophica]|uniref:Response regulator transcription factor n=1 Tax=Sulfurimonas autotrophica TaxID=202747 RepID=A0A7C3G907_9BACT|nr:response regulator transcription factor [Sulfurimonas autotrophica]